MCWLPSPAVNSIEARVDHGICEVRLNHANPKNPFSRAMTQALIALVPKLNADEGIKAVVLWGGADRSFSVGGDFRDISALKTETETRAYLLEIIDLYGALLRIDKPVVAAIDHCQAKQYRIYNLGGAQTTKLVELVRLLEQAIGKQAVIDWQPDQPGDVPITYADVTLADRDLHYRPKVDIQTGIVRFVKGLSV